MKNNRNKMGIKLINNGAKNLISILAIISLSLMLFGGCSKPEKVTFVLDWTPNTNHTGVYVAQQLGYFEKEGLNVEIIQPGESTADQLVATNSAQFGISYQEGVTFARAAGMPIVSLAAVIQHNTSGFASYSDRNITSAKDFEDKKYGGWGSDIESAMIKYLMEQAGGDFSKTEIITTGDLDFFALSDKGEIDYAWIFEGWAGIEAKLKGKDLNYIDLGKNAEVFDYYTPVIITNEENIKNNSTLVQAFMTAVSKGYLYAVENPEKAAELLIKGAPELEAKKDLAIESQIYLSDKYIADAKYWGQQKEEVWQRYYSWLLDNQFIEKELSINEAFTNDFLNK